MSETIIQQGKPIIIQGVFVAILVTGYSLIIVDSDINFFDDYVRDDIVECYKTNLSEHCQQRRADLGCLPDQDQQLCLGNKYWEQVNKQALGLAGILFFARLAPSIINHFSNGRKIRPETIFESFLWSFTALVIFTAGVIDVGYYQLRGLDVPDELPWLNHVGFFEWTKTLSGDPSIVNRSDLYYTFLIGLTTIFLTWMLAIWLYVRTGLKTLS